MNSRLFFFFLLPLISAESNDTRTVKHICVGNGKLIFQVNITENDTVNDIFSTDPQNSCSLSNNDFIGNGTEEFPYAITVDISDHLNSSQKPCGAKIVNESFEVQFAIKSLENFFVKRDRVYTIQCGIHKPFHSGITIETIYKEVVEPNRIAIKMTLVSFENSQPIPDGKLKLGQKVKLKVEILKENFAKRARVNLCYVQASQQNNTRHIFYNNRCSVGSFPVPINFVTNKTNPHLIESTDFKAFKIAKYDNLEWSCFVELCPDENDAYCLATDCVGKGTFMRYYTEVKTSVHTIISGASKQGSFTPMSITAIMILLTNIAWF